MSTASSQDDDHEPDLTDLVERLGHDFNSPDLLCQALTHPSHASEPRESYERLEFLGDRVLGILVSEMLFKQFPLEPEGALSRRFSALVRRETLADIARNLDLGRALRLAKPERLAEEHDNPAILADACEAVIGALYLDAGLDAARHFVEPLWRPLLESEQKPPQDAKTALQEWVQARNRALPDYRELAREGPDHEPMFTVRVSVEGAAPAVGRGRSKRLAEQEAAEGLLKRLRKGVDHDS